MVARLGGDWYARINEQNLFEVTKPNTQLGMGFDMLPTFIRESKAFSNNEKAQLANCTTLPESIAKNTGISLDFTDANVTVIKKELAGK